VNLHDHKFDPVPADEIETAKVAARSVKAADELVPTIPPDDAPAPDWMRLFGRAPVAHWAYRSENGKPLYFICRIDRREGYPHDVKVREAGSPGARTRIETLITMGRKPELVPNEDLMEGVNAGRKTIPFARFDAKRCAQGLESLRSYRTEWDEKARAFKKTPEHNWASHGADAWRYLSLS